MAPEQVSLPIPIQWWHSWQDNDMIKTTFCFVSYWWQCYFKGDLLLWGQFFVVNHADKLTPTLFSRIEEGWRHRRRLPFEPPLFCSRHENWMMKFRMRALVQKGERTQREEKTFCSASEKLNISFNALIRTFTVRFSYLVLCNKAEGSGFKNGKKSIVGVIAVLEYSTLW